MSHVSHLYTQVSQLLYQRHVSRNQDASICSANFLRPPTLPHTYYICSCERQQTVNEKVEITSNSKNEDKLKNRMLFLVSLVMGNTIIHIRFKYELHTSLVEVVTCICYSSRFKRVFLNNIMIHSKNLMHVFSFIINVHKQLA